MNADIFQEFLLRRHRPVLYQGQPDVLEQLFKIVQGVISLGSPQIVVDRLRVHENTHVSSPTEHDRPWVFPQGICRIELFPTDIAELNIRFQPHRDDRLCFRIHPSSEQHTNSFRHCLISEDVSDWAQSPRGWHTVPPLRQLTTFIDGSRALLRHSTADDQPLGALTKHIGA